MGLIVGLGLRSCRADWGFSLNRGSTTTTTTCNSLPNPFDGRRFLRLLYMFATNSTPNVERFTHLFKSNMIFYMYGITRESVIDLDRPKSAVASSNDATNPPLRIQPPSPILSYTLRNFIMTMFREWSCRSEEFSDTWRWRGFCFILFCVFKLFFFDFKFKEFLEVLLLNMLFHGGRPSRVTGNI